MAELLPPTATATAIATHAGNAIRAIEDVINSSQKYIAEVGPHWAKNAKDASGCAALWQLDLRQAQETMIQFKAQFSRFFL